FTSTSSIFKTANTEIIIVKTIAKITYVCPFTILSPLPYYTCGPSIRFFFLKSIGFSFKFLPRNKNHNWEAKNKDEYDPAINPTTNAIANPEIDSAPKTKKDNTAIKVVIVVLKLRINV